MMNRCADDLARLAPGAAAAAGVGLVACAACCAAPLLVAGGLGTVGVTTGALAALGEPWIAAAVGALVLAVVVAQIVRMRRERVSEDLTPATACGSACGCSSSAAIYRSPEPGADEPIQCTAGVGKPSAEEQLAGYRSVFEHLIARERFDGGFRWRFRESGSLEAELRTLAEREHDCCRFFSIEVRREASELVWETRAGASANAVLEEMYRLPERVALEMPTSALAERLRGVGLTFTADRR